MFSGIGRKPSSITPFLFHPYEKYGCLVEEEEEALKVAKYLWSSGRTATVRHPDNQEGKIVIALHLVSRKWSSAGANASEITFPAGGLAASRTFSRKSLSPARDSYLFARISR